PIPPPFCPWSQHFTQRSQGIGTRQKISWLAENGACSSEAPPRLFVPAGVPSGRSYTTSAPVGQEEAGCSLTALLRTSPSDRIAYEPWSAPNAASTCSRTTTTPALVSRPAKPVVRAWTCPGARPGNQVVSAMEATSQPPWLANATTTGRGSTSGQWRATRIRLVAN